MNARKEFIVVFASCVAQVAGVFRAIGLKWGGDWKSIKDKSHVELQTRCSILLEQQFCSSARVNIKFDPSPRPTEKSHLPRLSVCLKGSNYLINSESSVNWAG